MPWKRKRNSEMLLVYLTLTTFWSIHICSTIVWVILLPIPIASAIGLVSWSHRASASLSLQVVSRDPYLGVLDCWSLNLVEDLYSCRLWEFAPGVDKFYYHDQDDVGCAGYGRASTFQMFKSIRTPIPRDSVELPIRQVLKSFVSFFPTTSPSCTSSPLTQYFLVLMNFSAHLGNTNTSNSGLPSRASCC